ncbi:MAG: Tim44/TimA family putative adaptor protein [Hyphomicrobiaceae bacterium]
MQGNIDVLTLISLVVAVIVIIKLRSVLGRRTSDDEARIDRRVRSAREAQERAAAAGEKVVTLPRREREPARAGEPAGAAAPELQAAEARIKSYAGANRSIETGLLDIARRDPTFDPQHFVNGAKQAYEMIVTAFAEGNRRLLKDMLNRDVFEGFSSVIGERESRGEQIDQSFVGISNAEIVEAELRDRNASVTMKFASQLISATRDREGRVIAGDPQRIQDVTDIWTFSRDVSSRDPNWKLVATQAPA